MLFTDSIYCGGGSWKGDRCPLFVSATEWRQHVALDVSPQNRFALRIKATKWRQERLLSPLSWLACSTQIKERRAGSGCTFRGFPSCDRYGSDDGKADPSATLPTSVTVASDY